MALLKEICTFAWAVINNWAGYSTGGLIVALVALWHTLKEVPVSRPLGIGLSIVFMLMASFKAWQDQHNAAIEAKRKLEELTKPNFKISQGNTIISDARIVYGGNEEKATTMFIPLSVMNQGAPSVINGWKLFCKLKDGTELEGVAYLPAQAQLSFKGPKGEPILIPTASSLFKKGIENPIPTGGQTSGFMMFRFPGDLSAKMTESGTVFTLRIFDISGREYNTEMPMGTGKPVTEFMTIPGVESAY
jgi:hypothetical protein